MAEAVGPDGRAYRMGGDEFCALLDGDAETITPVIARIAEALSDHGEGFSVASSHGTVVLPVEARDPSGALRLADQRRYGHKNSRRHSAVRQSTDVLLQALREREPALGEHLGEVAALAGAVGRRLGLEGEDIEILVRAAELHDVGKVAVPDAILYKPGPLTQDEWPLVAQHSLVGERILSRAAALTPAASLVRSTHEAFHGQGYPDGLTGEEIPLGARIIAVCDAFDAMTSDRSYRRAMPVGEAVAELRRCAGSQFDPRVVEAFCAQLASGSLSDGRPEPTTSHVAERNAVAAS